MSITVSSLKLSSLGFKKSKTSTHDLLIYTKWSTGKLFKSTLRIYNIDSIIQLHKGILVDLFATIPKSESKNIIIARRFVIENHEQLKFLVNNGFERDLT